jgi:hypothetical protein
MEEPVAVLARGGQILEISRCETPDGLLLLLDDGVAPRSYRFGTLVSLVEFQNDMEAFLLNTGWSFVSYTPDCRIVRDRRGLPRTAPERRRWWTDGLARRPSH